MFRKKEDKVLTMLDTAIADAFEALKSLTPDDDEYKTTVDQIKELSRLRETHTTSRRVSPDTIAIVAANLAGIIIILGYEKANVIASKAFGTIVKPKI